MQVEFQGPSALINIRKEGIQLSTIGKICLLSVKVSWVTMFCIYMRSSAVVPVRLAKTKKPSGPASEYVWKACWYAPV